MSTILGIQCYPGGKEALKRHWPYFLRAGADEIWIIGTETGDLYIPDGAFGVRIGRDSYMDGEHLPKRLVDTFDFLLKNKTEFENIIVAEYDTVFLERIKIEAMECRAAAHLAGGKTWDALVDRFYHNPFVLKRSVALRFVEEGHKVISEGICSYGKAESSPDVFFALVMERLNEHVQDNLWKEFSRNDLKVPADLELARLAARSGFSVIHGVKSDYELAYITT